MVTAEVTESCGTTVPTQVPEQLRLYTHQEFVYIRGTGAIIVSIIATPINMVAIAIIVRHGVATSQNRLVAHMCFNNIVYSVFIMPFMAFSHFNSPTLMEIIPNGLCIAFAYLLHIVQGMAVFSLTLISLNRYFVILHPQDPALTFGGQYRNSMIIFTSWLITAVILFPGLAGIWGQYGFEPLFGVCTLLRTEEAPDKYFSLFITLLAFVKPLCIMVGCYARILWEVHQQRKRISSNSGNSSLLKGHRKKEMAITWLSLRLVVTFIVLNLPFTLTVTLKFLEEIPAFQAISTFIMWWHSILNPILYISGDSRLRRVISTRWSQRQTPEVSAVT